MAAASLLRQPASDPPMGTGEAVVTALALLLIAEGILPLVAPRAWREMFIKVMQFNDGQLRFFGLVAVLAGTLLLWL